MRVFSWFRCFNKEERAVLQKQVAAERERKRQELQAVLDKYNMHCAANALAELDGNICVYRKVSWERTESHYYTQEQFFAEYQPKLLAKLLAKTEEQDKEVERLRQDLDTVANGEKNLVESVLLKYKKSYPTCGGVWQNTSDIKFYVNGQEVVTKKPKKQRKKK